MEFWRRRLLEQIDTILDQMARPDGSLTQPCLQIDLGLVSYQAAVSDHRRLLLDPLDTEQLKHFLTNDRGASLGMPINNHPVNAAPQPVAVLRNGSTQDSIEESPILHDPAHFILPPFNISNPDTLISHQSSARGRAAPHIESDDSRLVMPSPPDSHDQQASKRRRIEDSPSETEQLAVDKLIEGVFEQIHNPKVLSMDDEMTKVMDSMIKQMPTLLTSLATTGEEFEAITKWCRQVTTSGRTSKFIEVIVQAYWVDCYDARLAAVKQENPCLRAHEYKRMILVEACKSLGWSEKELRNRMAIWKGYREIKNAAGWSALVFAGAGIYRFCKYRMGFDRKSMTKLGNIKTRAEVAADTLQIKWREMLTLVNDSTEIRWPGHLHDWTVSLTSDQDPLPLPVTYKQWDENFTFENISESVVDTEQWLQEDPRQFEEGPEFHCKSCTLRQSKRAEENQCECFPDLYSPNPRSSCPVQIFRTSNGKNNGLIACCSFGQGQAIGEFVGLITKGLADVDVMQSQAGDNEPYQIWQGRRGNFTRFMNHSCAPNCQFQTFSWLGVQRIVVVAKKNIAAEKELTVDYSAWYWENLDKICLCGEPCCRYRDPRRKSASNGQVTPMESNGIATNHAEDTPS